MYRFQVAVELSSKVHRQHWKVPIGDASLDDLLVNHKYREHAWEVIRQQFRSHSSDVSI